MFVSEIQDRVKGIFGDPGSVQIDDAMILNWINDGQTDICRKAECLMNIQTQSVSVGVTAYNYPTDFIREQSVKIGGIKLCRLTLTSIDVLFPDREADNFTGRPLYYFHWNRQINLYPKPDVNITNGLTLWYIRNATILTSSAQIPEIPSIFHEDLVEYCFYRALQFDENWTAAKEKKAEYDTRLLQTIYDSRNEVEESYPAVTLVPGDYSIFNWG